jgi:hypothetical protein
LLRPCHHTSTGSTFTTNRTCSTEEAIRVNNVVDIRENNVVDTRENNVVGIGVIEVVDSEEETEEDTEETEVDLEVVIVEIEEEVTIIVEDTKIVGIETVCGQQLGDSCTKIDN